MERGFLGINGMDSGAPVKQDGRGSQQALGPAVQCPFSNKISALKQFMSLRAGKEEKSKRLVFDQLSSLGIHAIATVNAFDANYKCTPIQAQQKFRSVDGQGIGQFPMHAYQSRSTGPFMHQLSEDTNRNASKPSAMNAQLTIFYAGSVSVYDNMPLDKAQAIMFLASKGSNVSSNPVNLRPEASVPTFTRVTGVDGLSINQSQIKTQTRTQNRIALHCSRTSSSISGSGCSTTADILAAKSAQTSAPTKKHGPSKATTAIPQARKASLTRFLEKRKERVANASPYSRIKESHENAVAFDGPTSKLSSADFAFSSEESMSLGCQPK